MQGILYLLGLPKTLYFNLKYLKLKDAVRLPILISHRVYLKNCGGMITINAPVKFGMVRIGYGDVGIFDQHRSRSIWEVSGKIVFKETVNIGHGSKIYVAANGTLNIGSRFTITAESQVVCQKAITFGNDVIISWDSLFIDTDFHKIRTNGQMSNFPKEIVIGNHVWVGCRCTILKGTNIGNDVIVAASSTVLGTFIEPNTIIGGNPAKNIKSGVTWEM